MRLFRRPPKQVIALLLLIFWFLSYWKPDDALLCSQQLVELDGSRAEAVVCRKVSDGDTVTVQRGHQDVRVRLSGIDAPEKSQAFGNHSRNHLSRLISNKPLYMVQTDQDKYGRLVAVLYTQEQNGEYRNVNLAMVEDGYAWHYQQYSIGKAYEKAQDQARAARLGLWADPSPTPPWEYRRRK